MLKWKVEMKVYRCKICGAVKSRKKGYFKVPDESRAPEPGQLEDPGKLRLMLHIAAAHLNEDDEISENDIEITDF